MCDKLKLHSVADITCSLSGIEKKKKKEGGGPEVKIKQQGMRNARLLSKESPTYSN